MKANTAHPPVGIVSAGSYLPGEPVDLVPWAAGQDVAPELVTGLVQNGCRYFHQAAGESDVVLIESAIERMRAPEGWRRRVRYVVHAHTQAFSMPAPPSSILAELCRRHGFTPALAFSVSQLACASAISAIDAAANCLRADDSAEYAVVVTSDRVFGNARHRIRGNTCIQSDGASAILLGREGLRGYFGIPSFRNFTQLYEGPSTALRAATMAHFLGRHTVAHLREHERVSGLPVLWVDEILPTNADRPAWEEAIRTLRLPPGKVFFDNIPTRGHACCADLAVNLLDRGFAQLDAGRSLLAAGTSNIGAFAAINIFPAPQVH